MPQPDPSRLHQWYDDFDRFAIGEWTVTNPNGGAGTGVLNANSDGGAIDINSDAGGGEDAGLYKNGRGFLMEVGRRAYFRCVARCTNINLTRIIIGLENPTSLEPEAPVDGIFFRMEPGATSFHLASVKDSVEVFSDSDLVPLEVTDDTDFELAFFWDGVSRLFFGIDGSAKGFIDPGASLPDDEVLTPLMFVSNGVTAVNRILTVDYMFAAKERAA